MLGTSKELCSTFIRRSRDLRPLSRDRSATYFQNLSELLETSKNVVWQSSNGRVTSDHCRVTVQRLFFNIFLNRLKRQKKRCSTVIRRSRDLRPLSSDRSATFLKIFRNSLKHRKNVVRQSADSRWIPTTFAWPFSDFFQQFFQIAWNIEITLFDSRPTVAWPPITVVWPFSDFFQNFAILVESSRDRPANLFPWFLWTTSHMLAGICLSRYLAVRIHSNGLFCLQRSYRSAFENADVDDFNISGTITTTETSFVPVGSTTLGLAKR